MNNKKILLEEAEKTLKDTLVFIKKIKKEVSKTQNEIETNHEKNKKIRKEIDLKIQKIVEERKK